MQLYGQDVTYSRVEAVLDGANLTAVFGVVARLEADSSGSLNVSGVGSSLSAACIVSIGFDGEGNLGILNGAQVNCMDGFLEIVNGGSCICGTDATIGFGSDSSGCALVNGVATFINSLVAFT